MFAILRVLTVELQRSRFTSKVAGKLSFRKAELPKAEVQRGKSACRDAELLRSKSAEKQSWTDVGKQRSTPAAKHFYGEIEF